MRIILVLCYFLYSFGMQAQSEATKQLIERGQLALDNRQYAEAIKWFAKASERQPNTPKIYVLMMKAAIFKRDLMVYKRCITQLEKLNYPQSVNIYLTYI